MTTIGRDELDTLATLARLSLDADERDAFVRQLGTIVEYLENLQGVAVDDVPEYVSPAHAATPLRDDVATPPFDRDAILAGCADTRDALVVVPRFMEP
jgi:aspartyl-tRNA(Asn)/glutamyl-tRNA(Gln) amidotransferase subunit C